jgi:hypothetical protein
MRTAALMTILALSACSAQNDDGVSTLYRSSFGNTETIRIATFDSGRGAAYNAENCRIVRDMLGSQPDVTATYSCAKGPAESSLS